MGAKRKVLVCDPVSDEGLAALNAGFSTTVKTGQTEAELVKQVGKYDAIVVRSQTKITAPVLEAAKNVRIVGRAGVGVDNIDVSAATRCGIIVVNSPTGNTLAAAEHTFALMMAMSRNIPQADRALRSGEWAAARKKYVGGELFGKTIGVIGLGKIGATVARRAKAFGMKVKVFDPFASEELLKGLDAELYDDVDRLLPECDYITLHVPKTPQTIGMIGKKQLASMKKTARIVNCSRGGIVDEEALCDALKKKTIAAAALDVFASEPLGESPLVELDNIVLTPHLGASTREAQENVVLDIADQIRDFFNGRPPRAAVNLPPVDAETLKRMGPVCALAEKVGFLQANLVEDPIQSVEVSYLGDFAEFETSYITRFVLVGLLKPSFQDSVNMVNANLLAQERGLKIQESRSTERSGFSGLVRVSVQTGKRSHVVAGTLFNSNSPRITRISEYPVQFVPEGAVLLIRNTDKPGVVGAVGTALGKANVNIAEMRLGRESVRGEAIMALSLDADKGFSSEAIVKKILKVDGVKKAKIVQF